MIGMDVVLTALSTLLSFQVLPFLVVGVLIGLLCGFLPGLAGATGMALALPFLYGMDPYKAIALLIGIRAVSSTGDTFMSVLFGIPGTAASQATILDGYPLAQQGQAKRALSASFVASMVGGIISGVILFIAIPIVTPFILAFASPELFMLTLVGLSVIVLLVAKNPVQGLLVGIMGLLAGTVGSAPAAPEYRFTYDWMYLYGGVDLTVVILAMFAIPEMIQLLAENKAISATNKLEGSNIQGIKDCFQNKRLMVQGSVLGSIFGAIPGLGASVVDWVAYFLAKKTVKNNENFGKGDIRGVIGPESANNACAGGSLIPTLLFSIPGSGSMAILLGGLTLMGISTGPNMITTDLPITLTIVWSLILSNIFASGICYLVMPYVSKLTTITPAKFVPFMLVIICMGSYQANKDPGDLILLLVVGAFAWFIREIGWPRIPFIIGFVLAEGSEKYFFNSMQRFGFDWLTRTGVLIIAAIIVLIFLSGPITNMIQARNKGAKA